MLTPLRVSKYRIERVNTTAQLPLAAAYNKELADLVYAICAAGFAAFGYERESWIFGH